MSLSPGTRFGPYEVSTQIGEGGMGEVYRATDTNLKRSVAMKVLPEAVAGDPARMARFQREAEVLARFSHPNIAQIYGLERAGGTSALVMELVDGPTLADRVAQGAVPVDEALAIAGQIADGLEAAHEQGIVHRDLKPANIKLRPDGTVKVLDFGLAKAVDPAGEASGDGTESPTVVTPAMTAAGIILGTAAYMSPEQARGRPVDKRADIWAFGVVLFEMLTGGRLFAGESVTDVLAAVVTREPDWNRLPASTPPGVRRLLSRCLERDPRRRLRDIGDARADLVDQPADGPTRSALPASRLARALPWGLFVAAALVSAWSLWRQPGSGPRAMMYLDIGLPASVEPTMSGSGSFGISPDGQRVVVVGAKGGTRRVFVRRLDQPEVVEVPGSLGANGAAFSPDSRSLAILSADSTLTIASLSSQQRHQVASGLDLQTGLDWSKAGVVFGRGGGLWIVSPEGGDPRVLTTPDQSRREFIHDHPVSTPNGRFVLFASKTADPGESRIEAVAVDGGARHVVVERATTPVLSPTGHLLYARDGAVMAAAFDQSSATLTGEAVPILPRGAVEPFALGELALTISRTGTLLYVPAGGNQRVTSVARDGAALELDLPPGRYRNPRVSPDGRQVLVERGGTVLESLDVTRGTLARLTPPAFGTMFPCWSADGASVVYRRFTAPYWVAADGSGRGGILPKSTANDYPSSAGPDPDSVLVVRIRPETKGDVYLMSISGAFDPRPLIATPAYEGGPQLSHDRHWLLYQSDASGQPEIYVQRYPALDRPWQVSDGGGIQARWGPDSREIFYRNGRQIFAVTMAASGDGPVFGKPTPLFSDEYDFGFGVSVPNYDVAREGRFIMVRRGASGGELRLVTNWTEELKQILASGGVH